MSRGQCEYEQESLTTSQIPSKDRDGQKRSSRQNRTLPWVMLHTEGLKVDESQDEGKAVTVRQSREALEEQADTDSV